MLEFRSEEEYRTFRKGATPEVREQLPKAEEAFPSKEPVRERKVETAREPQRREAQRGKRFEGAGRRGLGRAAGMAESVGLQIMGGLGKVAGRKWMRHPDDTIDPKAKYLYLPSNPKVTPLGRFIENPMELYFGRQMRMPPEAAVVLSALQEGYNPDQIEIVTGLTSQQVARGFQYLRRHKLISPEEEVR